VYPIDNALQTSFEAMEKTINQCCKPLKGWFEVQLRMVPGVPLEISMRPEEPMQVNSLKPEAPSRSGPVRNFSGSLKSLY